METFVGIPLLGDGVARLVVTLPPNPPQDSSDSATQAPQPNDAEAAPSPSPPQALMPSPSPSPKSHSQRMHHTEDPAELARMQLQYEKDLLEHQLTAVSEDRDRLQGTVQSLTTSLHHLQQLVQCLREHLPPASAPHATAAAGEPGISLIPHCTDAELLAKAAERSSCPAASPAGSSPASEQRQWPVGRASTQVAAPASERSLDEAHASRNAGEPTAGAADEPSGLKSALGSTAEHKEMTQPVEPEPPVQLRTSAPLMVISSFALTGSDPLTPSPTAPSHPAAPEDAVVAQQPSAVDAAADAAHVRPMAAKDLGAGGSARSALGLVTDDFWQSVTPPFDVTHQHERQGLLDLTATAPTAHHPALHAQVPEAGQATAAVLREPAPPGCSAAALLARSSEAAQPGGSALRARRLDSSPFAAESISITCTLPDIDAPQQRAGEPSPVPALRLLSSPAAIPDGLKSSPREQLQHISSSLCRRQERLDRPALRSPEPARSEQQQRGQATCSSSLMSPYPSGELAMASPGSNLSPQSTTPPYPIHSFVGYLSGAGKVVHLPSRTASPGPSPALSAAQSPTSQLSHQWLPRPNLNPSGSISHTSISSSLLRVQDPGTDRATPRQGLHRLPWSSQGELLHPSSRSPSAWMDPFAGSGGATPAPSIPRSPLATSAPDFLRQQQLHRMDDHALLLQVLDVAARERAGALEPLDSLLFDDGRGSSYVPEAASSVIAGLEEDCQHEQRIDELEEECVRLRGQEEHWRSVARCLEQRCKSLEMKERDLEKQLARAAANK